MLNSSIQSGSGGSGGSGEAGGSGGSGGIGGLGANVCSPGEVGRGGNGGTGGAGGASGGSWRRRRSVAWKSRRGRSERNSVLAQDYLLWSSHVGATFEYFCVDPLGEVSTSFPKVMLALRVGGVSRSGVSIVSTSPTSL